MEWCELEEGGVEAGLGRAGQGMVFPDFLTKISNRQLNRQQVTESVTGN